MTVEFLLTALIVVVMPGAGVLYTVATGLTRGGAQAVSAALGCTLGIVPHIAATVLGLAAVLHASAMAFQAVKIAGVLYLFYLAWSMWRAGGADPIDPTGPGTPPVRSRGRVALTGFAVNILNPKLSIFFLAFLPQFVGPGEPAPLWAMAELSAVFMGLTAVVFVLYGVLAGRVRRSVLDRPRVMSRLQRGFAVAFAALGVRLALMER